MAPETKKDSLFAGKNQISYILNKKNSKLLKKSTKIIEKWK